MKYGTSREGQGLAPRSNYVLGEGRCWGQPASSSFLSCLRSPLAPGGPFAALRRGQGGATALGFYLINNFPQPGFSVTPVVSLLGPSPPWKPSLSQMVETLVPGALVGSTAGAEPCLTDHRIKLAIEQRMLSLTDLSARPPQESCP